MTTWRPAGLFRRPGMCICTMRKRRRGWIVRMETWGEWMAKRGIVRPTIISEFNAQGADGPVRWP